MSSGIGFDPEIGGIVEDARTEFLARLTQGLADALGKKFHHPFSDVTLRGWIGLVEASTLAWLKMKDHARYRAKLRDLLVSTLLSMLQIDSLT
jgi:hypothetical protein